MRRPAELARQLGERRTARLVLRRMRAADLPDLYRMHDDPRVMATLGGLRDVEETQSYRAARAPSLDASRLRLLDRARSRAAGRFWGVAACSARALAANQMSKWGMRSCPSAGGAGLATELATESVRVGFEVLGLPDLVCFALPTNAASLRVMEKLGFRPESEVTVRGLPHVFCRLRA